MQINYLSEDSILVSYQQKISRSNLSLIRAHCLLINKHLGKWIVDIVPAYASILIVFRFLSISSDDFSARLSNLLIDAPIDSNSKTSGKLVEIPVYYGDEVALDLLEVAQYSGLSKEEIIEIHSHKIYDVYAVGFSIGFAYLGLVDDRIAMPRKATPRKKVVKGSLAIAEQQTAIYPSDSPGGWHIIGKTPQKMVDFLSSNLSLLAVGDQVRFMVIKKAQFLALGGSF